MLSEKEYLELYNSHLGISRRLFGGLLRNEEAIEWSDYAVHIAILTHDKEQGGLSTYVHYMAHKYRNEFVRAHKRWKGIRVGTNGKPSDEPLSAVYQSRHKYIDIGGKMAFNHDYNSRTGSPWCSNDYWFEAVEHEQDIDFEIDIREFLTELEATREIYQGRLIPIVEGWLSGETEEIIAARLGISRDLVSKIKQKARKELSEKFKQILFR